MAPARLAPCRDLATNGIGVGARELPGSHHHAQRRFGITESNFRRTFELDLGGIHEMKDHDLMPAVAEVAKGREREIALEQEIRNKDNHPASSEQRGEALQCRVGRRALAIRRIEETPNDPGPLTGFDPRGDDLPHLLIERHKTGRISLAQQNECERGTQPVGVRALREPLWRAAPRHRTTRVDQDHRAKVRFLFELFDEQSIGTSQDPPVEVSKLVPRLVGAVLGEFHRESAKRRAVQAGEKALHDALGDNLYAPQPSNLGGIEEI